MASTTAVSAFTPKQSVLHLWTTGGGRSLLCRNKRTIYRHHLTARHTVSRTLKPATTVVVAIIQADHGRSLSVSGPS
eukprot:jgi/Tetstr1/456989/TSEL_043654.t1